MVQHIPTGFRTAALVNFYGCSALQFAWLARAYVVGNPVRDSFLLFESNPRSPAWAMVLVGPLVLIGYFLSNPKYNVGFGGLVWLLAVRCPLFAIYGGPPLAINVETVIGIYALLSYAALAIFWRQPT